MARPTTPPQQDNPTKDVNDAAGGSNSVATLRVVFQDLCVIVADLHAEIVELKKRPQHKGRSNGPF